MFEAAGESNNLATATCRFRCHLMPISSSGNVTSPGQAIGNPRRLRSAGLQQWQRAGRTDIPSDAICVDKCIPVMATISCSHAAAYGFVAVGQL